MTLPTEPSQPPSRLRYGSVGTAIATPQGLGPVTRQVDRFFSRVIAPNRTQEMLVEDLVGFGGLRTFMDLMRNRIYGGKQWDFASARERLMREALSVLTDNVASGVLAFGMGQVLDKTLGGFSNRFVSFPTVELFQQLSQHSPSPQAFVDKLARQLTHQQPDKAAQASQLLQQHFARPSDQTPRLVAQLLGQTHFDVTLPDKPVFKLPELLQDAEMFLRHVKAQPGNQWQPQAQKALKRTLLSKHLKLTSLSAGFLLTFAVPYWIRAVTRKLDKQDTYPGERGIVQPRFSANGPANLSAHRVFSTFAAANTSLTQHPTPNRQEQWFPYLTRSFNQGNPMPLLLSALPLLFTFGLFDTVKGRFRNPLAPGFARYLRNAYDFGKGFPFTTQQQMASMYAFLIASRLSSSRSGNEYRERMVDSFLGWSLWILGTPAIKRAVSRLIDRTQGTQLVKPDGSLRARQEIEHLIKDGGKTLSKHVWIGALSTLATIGLLGIVEPYLAILWTKRNVQKQQQQAQKAAVNLQLPAA
jgi:hypothetical protein